MKTSDLSSVVTALQEVYERLGDKRSASDLSKFANLLTNAGDMKLPKFASTVKSLGLPSRKSASEVSSTRQPTG
jgi:hypothetical protein